ncbi:MAG: ribonuclease T2 [Paracoccaceae bacterium]
MRTLLAILLTTRLAFAQEQQANDFDYYVLALSWSPNWCALQGDARSSPQCNDGAGFGWVMHGLWPQYEQGWPSNCRTVYADPSRPMTNGMADIMGTSGLAWYQWKKHGRCSGLSAPEYYNTARRAYEAVNRPDVFRRLTDTLKLPASVVEAAFLRDNPAWSADMLTITCKSGHIQEARLCLTKDLQPRNCGADIVRDCSLKDAVFAPLK